MLVIWTDGDREGENIGFEIIECCQNGTVENYISKVILKFLKHAEKMFLTNLIKFLWFTWYVLD